MKLRRLTALVFICVLASCAKSPVKPAVEQFQLAGRNYLYDRAQWSFDGRLALSSQSESLSLSIDWKHQSYKGEVIDRIELAGPFGQGRTIISIADRDLLIDFGDRQETFVGDVDELLSRQIGFSVPVSALKYWVLGLVKPKTKYLIVDGGFEQLGWRVNYRKMMIVEGEKMPRKINVEREDVRLRLVVDQWSD
jgi:outer membrane lipoprotein LolB